MIWVNKCSITDITLFLLIAFSIILLYQKNPELSFQILLFYLRFLAMR